MTLILPRELLALSVVGIGCGLFEPSAPRTAACGGEPTSAARRAERRDLSCVVGPEIIGTPEVVGPARIRVLFKRSLPAELVTNLSDEPPSSFFVVDVTPNGATVVARGACWGGRHQQPEAVASDRDGTVNVLCVETETKDGKQTLFVRHGSARPGHATPITFGPPIPVHEDSPNAILGLHDPMISGFDDGGPYFDFSHGSVMFDSSKMTRYFHGDLLSLRGERPEPVPRPKGFLAYKEILWVGADGRFGGVAYDRRDREPERAVRFWIDHGAIVGEPTSSLRVPTGTLVASEDARGVVLHRPGRPLPVGGESFIPRGHAPSRIESWPADTALSWGSAIALSRAGTEEAVWSVRFPSSEAVESARASCDERNCVVVAIVGEESRHSSVLRTYRFDRPW